MTNSLAGEIGSASFACSGGTLKVQPGATCTASGAGQSCAAQTVSWTQGTSSCQASYGGGSDGSQTTVHDNAGPATGQATVTCSGGTPVVSAGQCSASGGAAYTCAPQQIGWAVGGNSCAGSYPGGYSQTSATVTDSTGPLTGSVTATCNASGSLSTSNATCGAGAATTCAAGQTLQWLVNSKQCSGTSTAAGLGATITVTAPSGNTGTAQFACQADGSFVQTGAATCAASGGGDGGTPCAGYPAGTSWVVNGNTCTLADPTGQILSGQSLQMADTTGTYQGSATGVCSNGTLSITNQSCYLANGSAAACPAATMQWTAGGLTCVGGIAAGDANTVISALDTNQGADGGTTGATGSMSYQCVQTSPGTYAWSPSGTPSCSVAAACPSGAVTWGAGNCGATLSPAPAGVQENLSNTLNATYSGGASFTCSSSGQWQPQNNDTCTPNPVACPATTITWQNGDYCQPGVNCCHASMPQEPSGANFNLTSASPSGSISLSCLNGQVAPTSTPTCAQPAPAPPPAAACPGVAANSYQGQDIGCAGDSTWNYAAGGAGSGQSQTISFGSGSSGTFQCSAGSWTFVGNSCR